MGLTKQQIDRVAEKVESENFSCVGRILPSNSRILPPSEFRLVSVPGSLIYHVSPLIHGAPSGTACGTLYFSPRDELEIFMSPNEGKNFCRACAATNIVAGIFDSEGFD